MGVMRCKFLWLLVGMVLVLPVGGCAQAQSKANETTVAEAPAESALPLDQLMAGNQRFVSGDLAAKQLDGARRQELLAGQHPAAVVVTCSDSRVPPELLFDQGLGDIFVVRVAGNVLDEVGIGSVEYAVEHLHTPLVMIMGHEDCGAVKASLSEEKPEGSIGAIVDMLQPAVAKARARGTGATLLNDSIQENVRLTVSSLTGNPSFSEKIESGELKIVGAEYQIGSGQVELLK